MADVHDLTSVDADMARAVGGIIALSVAGAPLGVFMMMRRLSLVGDAMSHAILPGVALAFLLAGTAPLVLTLGGLAAALVVLVGATCVARMGVLEEDGALAVFSVGALALGVTLITAHEHTGGGGHTHSDEHVLEQLMFGSVHAVSDTGLALAGISATATMFGLALIWRPLLLDAVDRQFLAREGLSGAIAHAGLLALVALALVAGFHALGALLAIGLVILPAAAAGFWVSSVDARVGLSIAVGLVGGVLGLVLARIFHLGEGPIVVLALIALIVVSGVFGPRGGLVARFLPAPHLVS